MAATWRHEWHGRHLTIRVEPLPDPPPAALTDGITTEVADLARFLGVPARWEWATGL